MYVCMYVCMYVGMDKNLQITTHFPLANINVNACEGDVLAFDFNREVTYRRTNYCSGGSIVSYRVWEEI